MNARPEVQLVWNYRAALNLLLTQAPNVALTYEVLTPLHGALTKRLLPGRGGSGFRASVVGMPMMAAVEDTTRFMIYGL